MIGRRSYDDRFGEIAHASRSNAWYPNRLQRCEPSAAIQRLRSSVRDSPAYRAVSAPPMWRNATSAQRLDGGTYWASEMHARAQEVPRGAISRTISSSRIERDPSPREDATTLCARRRG